MTGAKRAGLLLVALVVWSLAILAGRERRFVRLVVGRQTPTFT